MAAALGGRLDGMWRELYQRADDAAPRDVDEDLYGGFVGNADRAQLQRLRRLAPSELAARRPAFEDPRLEELLFRYRARNFPETLGEDERARWAEHCAQRLHGGVNAWHERIEALAETADERGQALLGALMDYADGIAP
jgi:exodeoxyribonuclease-1